MTIRGKQRLNRIKTLRTARNWMQTELAVKIGVEKGTIYRIEAGRQRITEPQAHDLARVFGVSIDDLYETVPSLLAGFAEEAAPFIPDANSFESRLTLDEHQSWYRIGKSRLDQIGFHDGTVAVIDISKDRMRDLHIGDVVIANKYPPKGGAGAETIVRQFIPPALLITNSLRGNLPPLNINVDDVSIHGIVVWPRPRG